MGLADGGVRMTIAPNIDNWRALAMYGKEIAARGWPNGRALRRLAIRAIRLKRRAYWRALVADRLEFGYRDIGGEG